MIDSEFCEDCDKFIIFSHLNSGDEYTCPKCSAKYVCEEEYFVDEGIVKSLKKV